MKTKKVAKYLIMALFILLLSIFLIRLFSPRHLDDLNPGIPCNEELIKKSDYLAVIPKYNNQSISDDKGWCDYVKSFNKTLLMHGVYHTYKEFDTLRDEDYIQEGRKIFLDCFNSSPEGFKPPQLAISIDNKKLLEEKFNFKVHELLGQIFHKTYHCDDSGLLPNWIQGLI